MFQYHEIEKSEYISAFELMKEYINERNPIFGKKYFMYSTSCSELLTFVREKKMINNLVLYISVEKVYKEGLLDAEQVKILLEYIKYTSSRRIYGILLLKESLNGSLDSYLKSEIETHLSTFYGKGSSMTLLSASLQDIISENPDIENAQKVFEYYKKECENETTSRSSNSYSILSEK